MTLRSLAKNILPRLIYKALAILKNGVPPDFTTPAMITGSEAEFFSERARSLPYRVV